MLLATRSMIKTRWVLRELMARYKISNIDLGKALGKHAVTIARLKSGDVMPQLSGEDLDELCNALTKLLKEQDVDREITYKDLFEHSLIEA